MFEKKRGTRFLASVMALVMLLSLAPVGALAADDEPPITEECSAMPLPANEDNPKPVVTNEENTENTNEETTPPPSNEGDAGTPADNNDTSTAVSEMPVIMNPVDLLNQASDYTTELTWSQPSSSIKDATFFYLKTPTSNPDSNTNLDWGDCLGKGKIDTSNLYWRPTGIWTKYGRVQNAYSVENNISEWPSAKVTKDEINNCYEIKKDTSHWNDVFAAYKSSIERELGVGNITEDDISSIILKPYKFSMNNEPDGYHVDCKIEVKCRKAVTATFYVQDASKNQDRYYQVESKNYKTNDIVEFPNYTDKDGYDFSGWYLDGGLNNAVSKDNYKITENVDFYAKYTPKTYTVIFDSQGGSSVRSQEVNHGAKATTPTEPTKAGFEFKGWYTSATCETAYDFATAVTEDITLYAQWTPNTYTVTFKTETGGKINGNMSDVTHSVAYDSDFPETPEVTADTHYEFDKWVDENGNEVTTFPEKVTGNATYTAKWKQVSTDPTPVTPVAARYIVEHYKWNAVTKTYALAETEYGPATAIGTTVTATPKQYDDYTLNLAAEGTAQEGTIPRFTKDDPQILTLKLYYDIDKIGNGENKNRPDGIPDRYQVTINYISNDNTMGTVSVGKEVKTIESAGKWQESGTVKISGSTAQPKENYHYVKWTDTDGTDLKSEATLPTKDISMTGGQVYTFTAYFAENSQPDPKKLNYTIIQHFRDGKGNPSTENPDITTNKTTTDAQTKLDSLITDDLKKPQTRTDGKTYVYVPGETKFTLNDKAVTTLVEDTEIHLYYYLDEVGGTPEKEGADRPDGTPDAWQYKVTFKVVNGSWNDKTNEAIVKYVTKKDAAGNNSATGTATLADVPAVGNEPNSGYRASGSWDKTLSVGLEIKGDTEFTYTYSRRSSSGGSSRPSTPTVTIPDDVPTGLNGKDHYAYIIGYGNNDVRPQNNITRAEVATIFFRLLTDETRTANMTKSNSYNDVKDGDWFCCAVSTLSKMGIIKGYEDGSFKPNAPISRAEFAAIAARFDPDGDKTPATFADVTSHWAKDEISIAANHGWIKGYEDGSFKPDQKITRAETMTLVNRVLNRLPETKDDLHKDMKTWVDNMDETAWYYLAVQEATNSHYFKNKTSTKFEQWTDLRDTRDWSELEK